MVTHTVILKLEWLKRKTGLPHLSRGEINLDPSSFLKWWIKTDLVEITRGTMQRQEGHRERGDPISGPECSWRNRPNLSGRKCQVHILKQFEASTVKLGSVCRDSSAISEIALAEVTTVYKGTQVPDMGFRRGPENHLGKYSQLLWQVWRRSSWKPIPELQTTFVCL